MMKQDIQTIAFQGNQMLTVERDEKHYVAMRTVCESIIIGSINQHMSLRTIIQRQPVSVSVMFFLN